MTLYARQEKTHRCKEQTVGLCGRRREWDEFSCAVVEHSLALPFFGLGMKTDLFLFILLYNTVLVCHTSTRIRHGYTRVPHPEPPCHLPPHTIPLVFPVNQPRASCIMHWTWTGDLFHIRYCTCFNAILSNHPTLTLSQSPKDCSIDLCLFAVSYTCLSLPSF